MALPQVLEISILLLASSPVTYAQHPKDIIGITVGMPFEDAKNKVGSGYTVKTPKGEDPNISYYVAYKLNEDGWTIEAIEGKVVFVQHESFFSKGKQPIGTELYKDLVAKYGTPGDGWIGPVGDAKGSYLFDQDGRAIPWGLYGINPTHNAKIACGIESSGNVSINDNRVMGWNLGFPVRMTPGCHQILNFHIMRDQQFVACLSVEEIDQDPIVKENARWQALKSGNAQQKIDDAKKIKVPM